MYFVVKILASADMKEVVADPSMVSLPLASLTAHSASNYSATEEMRGST